MQQETQRELLQQIANDERRPAHEREAARRATTTAHEPKPSPRRSRNANVPMTQADQDADIENSFRYDGQLTTQDRIEIERGLDPPTQAILSAFGSSLLWLFQNNPEEVCILTALHSRTRSEFVRAKAAETIRWIADYSPIESAKTEAQQFLNQLDERTE